MADNTLWSEEDSEDFAVDLLMNGLEASIVNLIRTEVKSAVESCSFIQRQYDEIDDIDDDEVNTSELYEEVKSEAERITKAVESIILRKLELQGK